METPLWYNFKQTLHVHRICQHILGSSNGWIKIYSYFSGNIFIRKGELILRRPPEEDSSNVLIDGEQVETVNLLYHKGVPIEMLTF